MNNPAELAGQSRSGAVPLQLKKFAAEGVLPIPEDELIPLQAHLSGDPDPTVSRAALKSLLQVSEDTWTRLVQKKDPDPEIISFCLRQSKGEVKERILLNHSVPDTVFAQIAERETGNLIDIVLNNQVRLLRDPTILASLERNHN